jgi:hypothetical protein
MAKHVLALCRPSWGASVKYQTLKISHSRDCGSFTALNLHPFSCFFFFPTHPQVLVRMVPPRRNDERVEMS